MGALVYSQISMSIHVASTVHKTYLQMRAAVTIQSALYVFDIGEICEYLTIVEVMLAFV